MTLTAEGKLFLEEVRELLKRTACNAKSKSSLMFALPEFRLFGQRGHDFTGGDDRVGEGRTVELGRVHLFPTFRRRRIFD